MGDLNRPLSPVQEQRVRTFKLQDHGDVDVEDPTDGYILTWVEAAEQWQAAAGVGVADHGALTGLGDDDHPQYILGERAILPFFDGSIVETHSITVTESGGSVFLNLEASGGGDLNIFFDSHVHTLDCTPLLSLALSTGTDTLYQKNWVYVTESGGVLTLEKSTTGFPATAHAPIATVLVQSAASVAIDGAYKVHAWTDHVHLVGENGHLSHLNKQVRNKPAGWTSGVAAADLSSNQFSTTAGLVFQLHDHSMPARDMATGDPLFVVNDNTTAFKRITSLGVGGVSALSDGTAIGNNKYVNLVLVGIVSEAEADCKLMLLLPDGQYTTQTNAEKDSDTTASYVVSSDFTGTEFLIARYTLKYSTAGGGSFTQVLKTDLRGQVPSTSPGGGAITDHGNLAGLVDDDHLQYHTDARADSWFGTKNLESLNNVFGGSPTNLDVLVYSSGLGSWNHISFGTTNLVDVASGSAAAYDVLSLSSVSGLYKRAPGGLAQLYNAAGVTTVPGSFGAMPWDTSPLKVGNFTHSTSTNNSEITCLKDGFIEVDVNLCFLYTSGGGNIVNAELQINSGGWATITGTARREQLLGAAGGSAEITINFGLLVTVDDKIRVRVKEAGGVCSMPANESSFRIKYVHFASD